MVKIDRLSANCALAALVGAVAWAPLDAATVNQTMAVTLTVEDSCNVNARPLAFGIVASSAPQIDAQSELAVACTPDAAYVVSMDDGRQSAAGKRRMTGAQGGAFVEYDIYRDAARTQRWGSSAATSVSGVIPAGGTAVLPVYGRISASQATADRYDDTVTVTVSF